MAVYYKWIKGCQAGAKLANSEGQSDAGLWTYLKWGTGTTGINQMPTLYGNIGKNDITQSANFGYLLSTRMAADPTIYKRFNFKSRIFLTDPSGDYDTDYVTDETIVSHHRGALYQAGNRFIIESFTKGGQTEGSVEYNDLLLHAKYSMMSGTNYLGVNRDTTERLSTTNPIKYRVQITENTDGTKSEVNLPDGVIVNGSVKIRTGQSTDLHNNLYVEGGIYLGTQFNADGTIKSNSATATFPAFGDETGIVNFYKDLKVHNKPVEAQYFNATSDKRAKENIQQATYNALELIKKLPVYTYNYKNNSENVTGILAQDLLEAQPKELDLVSNTNATGENNDYMSIKNDKLMFVLMKAIQEQQEQIERLESEIAKLKNSI